MEVINPQDLILIFICTNEIRFKLGLNAIDINRFEIQDEEL